MEVCQIQSGDGSCFEFSGKISIGSEQGAECLRVGPPTLSAPRYWNHQIIKTTIGHGEPQGGTGGAVCSGCVSIART